MAMELLTSPTPNGWKMTIMVEELREVRENPANNSYAQPGRPTSRCRRCSTSGGCPTTVRTRSSDGNG